MFKFESIIESLVEKKISKSKSVNNDKDLQKEELIQQIICFIERIIENTIQTYIDPINEQMRHYETQILQIQGQLISLHHISPKSKEIFQTSLNPEITQDIIKLEENLKLVQKQTETMNKQFIEFKHENKKSFYSYWVLLNDLNESVNRIKDAIQLVDDKYSLRKSITRSSTKKMN